MTPLRHLSTILAAAALLAATTACSTSATQSDNPAAQNPAASTADKCLAAAKAIENNQSQQTLDDGVATLGTALEELVKNDNPALLNAAATLMQALDTNEGYMTETTARNYWDLRQNMKSDERHTQIITDVEQATLTLGMTPEDIASMSETLGTPLDLDTTRLTILDLDDDPTRQ